MVLADDNFATIAAAVEEGRTVYDNLKKSIAFILPTNGGEALVIVAAVLFGSVLPITPVQILWVNMVTAVTLGLALAFEPAESDVMARPPRRPDEPLLSRFLLWRIAFVSLILLAGTFGLFLYERAQGAEHRDRAHRGGQHAGRVRDLLPVQHPLSDRLGADPRGLARQPHRAARGRCGRAVPAAVHLRLAAAGAVRHDRARCRRLGPHPAGRRLGVRPGRAREVAAAPRARALLRPPRPRAAVNRIPQRSPKVESPTLAASRNRESASRLMVLRSAAGRPATSLLGRYAAELARIVDHGQAELALAHGRQLRKLDALMRNIVQQSFDGILAVGADGRVADRQCRRRAHVRLPARTSSTGRHMLQLFPELSSLPAARELSRRRRPARGPRAARGRRGLPGRAVAAPDRGRGPAAADRDRARHHRSPRRRSAGCAIRRCTTR